jgi:hypothetical protein
MASSISLMGVKAVDKVDGDGEEPTEKNQV